MKKFDGNIPDIQKLTDQKLTQELIPARLIPEIPPKYEGKNVKYIFDSSDSFNLTYDELVEIVSKARNAGPRMIPVLGTIGETTMDDIPLHEKLFKFVKHRGGNVSFVEFQNEFPEIKGGWDFILTEYNLLLWSNVTEEFIQAIDFLIKNDKFKFAPCEELVYIGDGVILDYPIAKDFKAYATLKWFPIVFSLI